jgi:tRNA pseudouridine38-40 synthase
VEAFETPETPRFELTVHYDGSAFHGWQFQPDRRTVQGELQAALTRLADRPCSVLAAGRTDAGVHATGQIAVVDLTDRWTPQTLLRSLNAILPNDIWIERVRTVPADFHPRYDAVARSYHYRVGTAPECASPFHRRWCWPLAEELDLSKLNEAAGPVVGPHSFNSFAKAGQPERGYACTVARADWHEWELGLRFEITADRYLHHMVRYLVGTMVEIARGKRPLREMAALLAGDEGLTTSPPAPPEGLFLVAVEYPEAVTSTPDNHTTRSTATA